MIMTDRLIHFLGEEFGIKREQIKFALRQLHESPHQLAMILWQYGLVDLVQLDKIFDWLETA
jgi:hypothetical protein